VIHRRAAAYLPARHAQRHIDAGELHLVPGAPRFPYPIWLVWRDDADPIVRATADSAMARIVEGLDETQHNILQKLADISLDHEVHTLGEEVLDIHN
jgi:hypothetical protein